MRRAVLSVPLVLLLAVPVAPPGAAESVPGYPDCENHMNAAHPGGYTFGRIQTVGYAYGEIAGIDLQPIDTLTFPPIPKIFKPKAPPPVQVDWEVVGATVNLHFDGLSNQIFAGEKPYTQVLHRTAGVSIPAHVNHVGAHTLTMLFSGHFTIWAEEVRFCGSVDFPGALHTMYRQRIRLDGYATAVTTLDDPFLEGWGYGMDVRIGAGDTQDW